MRYNTYHLRTLHTPMLVARRRRGLRGLLGLGATLTLKTDKPSYVVGEAPIYQILGGTPNATIAWTSFKDGVATSEYEASYGQSLDSDGKGVFTADPWTADDVGWWQKQVILSNPDGTTSLAQVVFTVSPVGAAAAPPPEPGFLDKQYTILGQQISGGALLGLGAGIVLLMFMKR